MSGFTKGGRDFLELGTWDVMCAYCGRKRKANELVRDNEFARGLWCCPEHADPRHPQDFVRGIKEDMAAPFVQPPVVAFTSLSVGLPISIVPGQIRLLPENIQYLTTELPYSDITTEDGNPLITESTLTYTAYAFVELPPWISQGPGGDPTVVYVDSFEWSWLSGGVGISILAPNSVGTGFYSITTPSSGAVKVTVTDSLGGVSTATAFVST